MGNNRLDKRNRGKAWVQPKAQYWWGRVDDELNVWDAALARTRLAFEQFDHCSIQFSGGKDSTCVLNVALLVAEEMGRLPLDVQFFDEEAIPYETEDYCRRVAADPRINFRWYCLPVQHRNSCSRDEPVWWPWAPESEDLWVRPLPPEAITWDMIPNYPTVPDDRPPLPKVPGLLYPSSEYGTVIQLMGIRAQESLSRTRAVANGRSENWVIPARDVGPNMMKGYPIYDWTTEDVWTAPQKFGWDYNRAYDMLEMAGMSHHGQRCAPPFGEQPMQALWTFKCCFPDLWEPMTRRVPGAQTAARYAKTELYSFGDIPDPPPGVTWKEHLRTRIEAEADPATRAYLANRTQREIKGHYKKTSDPLVSAPHPVTGIGWRWLYKIVDRGDFKARVTHDLWASQDEYDAARALEAPETLKEQPSEPDPNERVLAAEGTAGG